MRISALFILIVLCFAADESRGQSLSINGGNISMTITTGQAGLQPLPVTNVATSLRYRRTLRTQKISVSTSCPGQRFNLSVLATSVSSGTAAPEVSLLNGMPSTDVIVNIPLGFFSYATATLNYEASSTFAQGNSAELGNDVHTVTYTLTAQ